jgi:Ca-dependent carbohydrate-binding module xylan-binding
VDNLTAPNVTVDSSPVTITEPPAAAPPAVTIGTGTDTLALQVSEDAWQGNAQFTVSVDGKQVGGTQTAVASHAAGQTQTFNVLGTFAAGTHVAAVDFLNDAYGGSPAADRNLYVTGATIDNSVISAATLTELSTGAKSFNFLAPGSSGSGSADTVSVNQPTTLQAGLESITGTESDPSQSIFLDWNTSRIPALTDSGWVQAKVGSSGAFSASVTIDPAGTVGALFYRIGSGPTLAAWSGVPS